MVKERTPQQGEPDDSGRGRLNVWFLAPLALWLVWAAGQVFREHSWPLEFAFYVPSLVVLVILLGIAFWAWRRRNRSMAIATALLALAPAVFVGYVENRFFAHTPGESSVRPALRLVHWNVCHGRFGEESVRDELGDEAGDLYVLSEPGQVDLAKLADDLGGEVAAIGHTRLAIVARGQLAEGKWLVNSDGVSVYGFRWTFAGRSWKVFAVDLSSALRLPRGRRLRRVVELIELHQPDIVVGDFNAPRRCEALCSLPSGYAHAYDVAGSGWSYTWPVPLPVYAIDQCLVGPRVRPIRYRLATSIHSDHRRQIFDFTPASSRE